MLSNFVVIILYVFLTNKVITIITYIPFRFSHLTTFPPGQYEHESTMASRQEFWSISAERWSGVCSTTDVRFRTYAQTQSEIDYNISYSLLVESTILVAVSASNNFTYPSKS